MTKVVKESRHKLVISDSDFTFLCSLASVFLSQVKALQVLPAVTENQLHNILLDHRLRT